MSRSALVERLAGAQDGEERRTIVDTQVIAWAIAMPIQVLGIDPGKLDRRDLDRYVTAITVVLGQLIEDATNSGSWVEP